MTKTMNLTNFLQLVDYKNVVIYFFCLFFLSGCFDQHQAASFQSITLTGRDSNRPIYRLRLPSSWQKELPVPDETLKDTTKPLGTLIIAEGAQTVTITIHNFPFADTAQRIPPMAQVARWKRQFDTLGLEGTQLIPQAFSGYVGICFEGTGIRNNDPLAILAWALQIAPMHLNILMYPATEEEHAEYPQMRADVTIKAAGDPDLLEKYKDDIVEVARSFELLKPIPAHP